MTPKERATMQQALEALREYRDTQMIQAPRRAITALREVLAEQAEQKPVENNDWKKASYIRETLNAEQAEQEPVGDYVYQTIEEYEELCGFDVNEAFRAGWRMARTTNTILGIKAAQQPCGYQYLFSSPFGGDVWRDSDSQWNGNKPKASRAIYAAPVRTKDLTDDDLEKTYDEICRNASSSERLLFRYARAVIAADREKNK